jgi:D-alanyl-lipoteichoic acid acyltransferase DltB (MBOAT superfamily)
LFAGLLAWLVISKTVELVRDLPRDPLTRTSTGAFLLWLVMPPALTWPADEAERASFRASGVRRASRGLLKAACLVGLIALSVCWPALHTHVFAAGFWGLLVCYLVFSGGMDLGTSIPMLFGVHVAENFDRPFLAISPRELWGRRWNLWFHGFVFREVFIPFRRSPRLAVLTTFVVSGLAHEFLIIAALGRTHGQMLAFFTLQGLAFLVPPRLTRSLPRALAWALHMSWLIITAPLFLEPIFQVVPLNAMRSYL